MAISIKDEKTDQLARKVAFLTGLSLTEAIANALEEKLDRLEHNFISEEKYLRILAIQDQIQRVKSNAHSLDHGSLLYDESGLPV